MKLGAPRARARACLHLDLEFLTFDQAKVRGALPEMWGLQPMSEGTKLLLDKKNVDI